MKKNLQKEPNKQAKIKKKVTNKKKRSGNWLPYCECNNFYVRFNLIKEA